MAKAAAKKAKGGGGKGKPNKTRLYATILAPFIGIASYPTLFLLMGGLVPTLAAFVVDPYRGKYVTKTVAFLNFAGCLPFVLEHFNNYTIEEAFAILSDPFKLLTMYGAAALGWMLYFAMPPVCATWLAVSQELRMQQLRSRQQDLIKEWGSEIREAAGLGPTERTPEKKSGDPKPEADDG